MWTKHWQHARYGDSVLPVGRLADITSGESGRNDCVRVR